jgi:hypothetical protein
MTAGSGRSASFDSLGTRAKNGPVTSANGELTLGCRLAHFHLLSGRPCPTIGL